MDQQDDRVGALALELRDQRIGARRLLREAQALHSGRGDEVARVLQRHSDEAKSDRAEALGPGRGENRGAVRLQNIGGQVAERRAAKRPDRTGRAARELRASAILHPLELVGPAVEFVIADRIELQPEQIHRGDGRLVEVIGGDQRRGADGIARRNGDRIRMAGAQLRQRARQVRNSAGLDLAFAAVRLGHLDRRGRFQIAVEVVEGEDLHLDGRRRNNRRDCRWPGRAAGERQQPRCDGNLAKHQRGRSAGSGWGEA